MYEFQCKTCTDIKEKICSIGEEPNIICEKCNEKMHKIISGGYMINIPVGASIGKENYS